MVKKYGAEDWYLWRLDNWGTKWDTARSHGTLTVVRPTKIKLDVKTAWTPPIPVFDRWVDLGCHVRAQFCEPEWDVAGTYVNKSVNVIRSHVSKNKASRFARRLGRSQSKAR
jgi:hypothetical protein